MTSSGLHTTLKTCPLLKRESDSSDSRFSFKAYGFEQRNSPVGTGFTVGSHGLRRHDFCGLFVQLDQVST